MKFNIITIFPDVFSAYFQESIIGRAQKKGVVKVRIHDLRDFTDDKHCTVDDRPYGGGAGMVLMTEPIYKAVKSIKKVRRSKIILLSAKGKKFDQKKARTFSRLDQLIIICGRYEGVDERVAKYIADEEISIGDYVLTGGELPAMVVVDAVTRLIPGVIRKESLAEESFSADPAQRDHEYPHYTRPESMVINGKKRKVPKVLLSGHHEEIARWRREHIK